jgi:hypothetical protein
MLHADQAIHVSYHRRHYYTESASKPERQSQCSIHVRNACLQRAMHNPCCENLQEAQSQKQPKVPEFDWVREIDCTNCSRGYHFC